MICKSKKPLLLSSGCHARSPSLLHPQPHPFHCSPAHSIALDLLPLSEKVMIKSKVFSDLCKYPSPRVKTILEEEYQKEVKERGDGHNGRHQPGDKVEQGKGRLFLREDVSNCNLLLVFLRNICSCKKYVIEILKYREISI